MKHVSISHGCLDAVLCGDTCKGCGKLRNTHAPDYKGEDKATDAYAPQGKHICGQVDACSGVSPKTGEVCTFGTTTRVTFHELSDIEAEVVERSAHHQKAHGGITPADTAAIRVTAAAGKNLHSAKAEKDFTDAGHKHHADNKSLHDSNPAVFGH